MSRGLKSVIKAAFRRFKANEEAATAIEFALVAMPFTYLLIGIIEVSLMFGATSTLQGATSEAARMIRTGQVQQASGDPEQVFSDKLCELSAWLIPCGRIQYEVIHLNSYADYDSYPMEFDENGAFQPQGFDPGGVNDVILVRTAYNYQFMTPLIGDLMAETENGRRLLVSTVVLQTEPYDINEVASEL